MTKQAIRSFLIRAVLVIFVLLSIGGTLLSVGDEFFPLNTFLFSAPIALVVWLSMRFFEGKIKKLNPLKALVILSIICFFYKFLFIYKIRIAPEMDYKTYYDYALALAENFYAPSRYVALFPHIFGYSLFLSFFIKIFGASLWLAPVINVILTVVSGILIFLISYRLINLRAGIFAYLFYIVCPSQSMYNSLVISDLLYTTLILLFIFILIQINKEGKLNYKTWVSAVASGVILSMINACRPIAVILIIALILWLFIIRFNEFKHSAYRNKWLMFALLVCVFYYIFGQCFNFYLEKRLGEEAASSPGYNIYVGFNEDSNGSWNIEDSELLTHYSNEPNATANSAQNKMLAAAGKRIISGEIDFLKLFKEKLKIFSGDDAGVVFYLKPVLNHTDLFTKLSNGFYFMLLFLLIPSFINLWRKKDASVSVVIMLFVIGLFLAQMLVEVAPRYHYSLIPMFIIITQYSHKKKTV